MALNKGKRTLRTLTAEEWKKISDDFIKWCDESANQSINDAAVRETVKPLKAKANEAIKNGKKISNIADELSALLGFKVTAFQVKTIFNLDTKKRKSKSPKGKSKSDANVIEAEAVSDANADANQNTAEQERVKKSHVDMSIDNYEAPAEI